MVHSPEMEGTSDPVNNAHGVCIAKAAAGFCVRVLNSGIWSTECVSIHLFP